MRSALRRPSEGRAAAQDSSACTRPSGMSLIRKISVCLDSERAGTYLYGGPGGLQYLLGPLEQHELSDWLFPAVGQ